MNILNILTTCVSIGIIVATTCALIGGLLCFVKYIWEFITDWKIDSWHSQGYDYKNKKH